MLETVNDFILEYCNGVTQDILYRGWQNRMALPKNDTYIIYSLETTERIGTNVSNWTKVITDPEVINYKVLRRYTYTIDFFSTDNEQILKWACALETAGRTEQATKYFEPRGCKNAYTDEVEYIPYTDLNQQYVERYRVRLHLTKWESLDINQDFANEIKIKRIINIDEKR